MEQMYKSGALVQDRKVEKMEMEIEKGMKGKHSKIWAHPFSRVLDRERMLQETRGRKSADTSGGWEIDLIIFEDIGYSL